MVTQATSKFSTDILDNLACLSGHHFFAIHAIQGLKGRASLSFLAFLLISLAYIYWQKILRFAIPAVI